jgi:hypothetical protein
VWESAEKLAKGMMKRYWKEYWALDEDLRKAGTAVTVNMRISR